MDPGSSVIARCDSIYYRALATRFGNDMRRPVMKEHGFAVRRSIRQRETHDLRGRDRCHATGQRIGFGDFVDGDFLATRQIITDVGDEQLAAGRKRDVFPIDVLRFAHVKLRYHRAAQPDRIEYRCVAGIVVRPKDAGVLPALDDPGGLAKLS